MSKTPVRADMSTGIVKFVHVFANAEPASRTNIGTVYVNMAADGGSLVEQSKRKEMIQTRKAVCQCKRENVQTISGNSTYAETFWPQ